MKFKRKVEKKSSSIFERIDGDNEEKRPFSFSEKNCWSLKRRIGDDSLVVYSQTQTEGRPHTLPKQFLLDNRMHTFHFKEVKEDEKENEAME